MKRLFLITSIICALSSVASPVFAGLLQDSQTSNPTSSIKQSGSRLVIEGVLKMCVLDVYGEGGYVNQFRETDFDHTYFAFVVTTDKALEIAPYLSQGDLEWLAGDTKQSRFMIIPNGLGSDQEVANRFGNKRVRIQVDSLSVALAGWRYASEIVAKTSDIRIIQE